MNKEIVTSHLEESLNEIKKLLSKLSDSMEYTEDDFAADLDHIYHHLNTSWNGRKQNKEQFNSCTESDVEMLRKYPNDSSFYSLINDDNSADWYLADIVMVLCVESETSDIVHINSVLISAESGEQAYKKALIEGKESESAYKNCEGKNVLMKFLGLNNLSDIDDEIENGTEVIYTEKRNLSEKEIQSLISPKEDLHIFRKSKGTESNINYMPGDIWKKVKELRDKIGKENQKE